VHIGYDGEIEYISKYYADCFGFIITCLETKNIHELFIFVENKD
jgi:hypothetical protein